MSANVTTFPNPAATGSDRGETVHWICCDERRAPCGLDMAGGRWTPADVDCVVCVDLEFVDCTVTCAAPDCGAL